MSAIGAMEERVRQLVDAALARVRQETAGEVRRLEDRLEALEQALGEPSTAEAADPEPLPEPADPEPPKTSPRKRAPRTRTGPPES